MKLPLPVGVVAAVLLCSSLSAGLIEEISVTSVDTDYDYVATHETDSLLTIAQSGVTVVIEKPGNVQEEVSGASFSMGTNLLADHSVGGKAVADFWNGSITIKDSLDVLLLSADILAFRMEENTTLPFCVLAGAGTFDVTGGTWAAAFGPGGTVFDLTWKFGTNIASFREDFAAESDVTLTPVPEPSLCSLLAVGGAPLLRRRRR